MYPGAQLFNLSRLTDTVASTGYDLLNSDYNEQISIQKPKQR